jgi:exonuclease SbcC
MDFKSFFTSIFAKQKELNALSSMNPSERRPLILRMLGIDAIDEVIAEIRSDAKHTKNLVDKSELDLVDEQGTSRIEKLTNELHNLKKTYDKIEKDFQKEKNEILKAEKEYDRIRTVSEKEKSNYEEKMKTKENLEEKKNIVEKKKTLEEKVFLLNQKLEKRKEARNAVKKNRAQFSQLEEQRKELENHQQETTDTLEKLIKILEQKKSIISRIQEETNKLERKKKEIKHIGPTAKCPTCERVLGNQFDTLIKTYDGEILNNNKKRDILEKERIQKEEEYNRYIKEQLALQKKSKYLQRRWIEKEKINTTLESICEEINREEQELKELKQKLSGFEKIIFEETQYLSLKKDINQVYQSYQRSLNQLNSLRTMLERKKLQHEKKEGRKTLIKEQIKNIQQQKKEKEKQMKQLKKDKETLVHLSMVQEVMTSFRTYLISQIRPMLSFYASELLEQLTDGKYAEMEIDENYNLVIYDEGHPYTIERFSGGEEDLANLCLRLAISEVITQRAGCMFQFIVLDEIFGSQDINRKQNIIKALTKFSAKFRQILLITHIEEMKNFMENAIAVYEEDSGYSRIRIE